jgi:5'(3')-deoxyribonucleotidase
MTQRKTVALDIDDVLAGFFSGISAHYDVPEIKCDIWDGKDVNKWISEIMIAGDLDDNALFWLDLGLVSHPNSINFKVDAYITSSPESALEWRKIWLQRAGFPDAPVVHCKNKIETMERLGIDILVDDSPKTCKAINDNSGPEMAIQFVPPYMSVIVDEKLAITHLSELNKFLTK